MEPKRDTDCGGVRELLTFIDRWLFTAIAGSRFANGLAVHLAVNPAKPYFVNFSYNGRR